MNASKATALFRRRYDLYNKSYNAIISLTTPSQMTSNVNESNKAQPTALKGVPVAVKEVIDVEGFPTTLCDPSLRTSFAAALYTRNKSAEQEATIVTKLKEAGAIIIGKTNIPKKGLDVQCSNADHGTTTNPWDPLRTSGGSSGGSCVAVATGMVPLALGTDLGGSLRIPASFCGVSSIRCSYGVIPTKGQQPPAAPPGDDEAESSLQVGPIARDVRTLERFFRGTKLLNIPEENHDDNDDATPIKIALSTGIGGMESDYVVKDFLESTSKNRLHSLCKVSLPAFFLSLFWK